MLPSYTSRYRRLVSPFWLSLLCLIAIACSVSMLGVDIVPEASSAQGGGSQLPRCLKNMTSASLLTNYVTYLSTYASVTRAFNPCQYSTDVLDLFVAKLTEAELTGEVPSAPLPQDYVTRNLDFVSPTPAEWNEILAAKLAHIFVLEVKKAVPWRLADYSSEDLKALFNVCRYDCTHIVLDYSPRVAWTVLQQRIDLTALVGRTETMVAILKHMRDFIHGSLGGDTSIATLDEMAADKIARQGCHSTTRYLTALAQALNIPGTIVVGYYAGQQHSSALFKVTNQVLAHGDDPYNALLDNTPAALVYDSYQRWAKEVLVYKPNAGAGSDLDYYSRKYTYTMDRLYPSAWLLARYCGMEPSSAAGRAYLVNVFQGDAFQAGWTFATDAELDDLARRISATTNGCMVIPPDNPEAH